MSSLRIQKRKLLWSLAEMGLFHGRNGLGRYLKDLNMLRLEERAFLGEGTRRKGLGEEKCLHSVEPQERERGSWRQGWKVA